MDVIMPQLGETVAEGTVVAWHKKTGDRVAQDEVLLDVETEKAAMEIPAPASGVLTAILVEEGGTVEVGAVLAVIGDAEELAVESEMPVEPVAESAAAPLEAGGIVDDAQPISGPDPRAPAEPGEPEDAGLRGRQLSPVVRRLIAEHDLDVDQIAGSGRNGRITRNDVLAVVETAAAPASVVQLPGSAVESQAPEPHPEESHAPAALEHEPPQPPSSPQPEPPMEPTVEQPAMEPTVEQPAMEPTVEQPPMEPTVQQPAVSEPAAEITRVPFDRIRRVTAEHMVRSKATSPHVLQTVEVDFSSVDRARLAVREAWRDQHGFSLTFLPFIARAVCLAIREFPRVNARVEGDALLILHKINLAIAVDLNFEGLVAPVVRDAAELTVPELAHAFHAISQRARNDALTLEDLSGGTYTLSNPGAFGMLFTAPIINQPQVAILSIDGVKKRPVVVETIDGDGIAIRPIGVLAQSFDHRAFDGAYSAAFLNKLRALIEQTDWSMEL